MWGWGRQRDQAAGSKVGEQQGNHGAGRNEVLQTGAMLHAVSATLCSAESSEKMEINVANECGDLIRKHCGGEVVIEVQSKWTEQMRKNGDGIGSPMCRAALSGTRCWKEMQDKGKLVLILKYVTLPSELRESHERGGEKT